MCFFLVIFVVVHVKESHLPVHQNEHSQARAFQDLAELCIPYDSSKGVSYKFLSRGTAGSSILYRSCGHLYRGRHTYIKTF